MASSVETRSPTPSRDSTSSPSLGATSSHPNRRSRILAAPDTSMKRLSLVSNPSRESPPPPRSPSLMSNPSRESPPPPRSPSLLPNIDRLSTPPLRKSSPSPGPPPTSTRKPGMIPSFPPPQASRISLASVASTTNRDSFHPQFASSLSYALVRDFAYPAIHPLHYGPPMASGLTTPGDSLKEAVAGGGAPWFRRLSDPAVPSTASVDLPWDEDLVQFRLRHANQPPPLNFADGPPWSEDEDLQSPVVVPKHAAHRKHKSAMPQMNNNALTPKAAQGYADKEWSMRRRSTGIDGSYYRTSAGPQDLMDGEPGGELYHHAEEDEYDPAGAGYYDPDYVYSDDDGGSFRSGEDDATTDDYSSRFSKDYQFTIASPAEEMHGKAVALFDFIQENENELPLVEGQVVWVSYRHGMGWLVAEDPKTGESGLVPEEYVCLLRDMQAVPPGEMNNNSALLAAPEEHNTHHAHVSHFSTSSQDVHPYGYQLGHEESRERLEQIRREHEDRAARELEDAGTPRLGSEAFHQEEEDESQDGSEGLVEREGATTGSAGVEVEITQASPTRRRT